MKIEKLAQITLKVFLILILVCMAGLGIIYVLMQRNPEELANRYLSDVAQKTGLDISFNSVHVTLLPLPAIGLGDLNIKGENIELNIAWIALRPSLENLLHGDFLPGHISIFRPKLYYKSQQSLCEPLNLFKEIGKSFPGKKSDNSPVKTLSSFLPFYCGVDLIQGYAQIKGVQSQIAILNNLEAKLEILESGILSGEFDFGYLRASDGKRLLYALESFSVKGETDIDNILEEPAHATVAGRIRTASVIGDTEFTLQLENSVTAWSANLDLKSHLNLQGTELPATLSGRVFSLADSNEIICRSTEFSLDADSGVMDLQFRLPTKSFEWQLKGNMALNRVSLTQWLGFARGLPPGLQMALDNITNARLDFILNNHSLKVTNISATATGALFEGEGGVPDFAKPVVVLDLKSKKANLGLAIPESLVKTVEPVNFPHEPLTPKTGKPLPEGEQGVDYDIKLAAATLIYGPLTINNANLRIYPGRMDTIRLEDVLLDGSGDFYGGSLKGHCILGADPSLPIYISYQAKNVNMANLARVLPELPVKKGIFQGEAKVFSKGKKLDEFLGNLDGPVNFSGSNVIFKALDREQISKLALNNQLKGAKLIKNGVSCMGKWGLEAALKEFSAVLNLDGRLNFDSDGLSLKSVPASMKISFKEKLGPIPRNSSYAFRGQLTGQSASSQFSLQKASLELPGVKVQGNVNINAKNANCQGEISANVTDLQKLAKAFSQNLSSVPPAFSRMEVKSGYILQGTSIKLQKLSLKSGHIQTSGTLEAQLKAVPSFTFDLSTNRIDWEKDFGNTKDSAKKDWDFSWLKEFNCKGKLKIDSFLGWGFTINDIGLPLELEKGKLAINSLTGVFCGAPMRAQVEAEFNKGVNFKTIVAAKEFKLEDVAKASKMESVLLGKASVDAVLSATLDHAGQLVSRLHGLWNLKVVSGSFQSRDKKGNLKGSPTMVDLARASGKISNGRLESKDLLLRNADMEVSGEGWLDLVSDKVDCKLNVNMKNVPDFPLYVYGPVNNPKTSIGAGKLVLNALGGITSGIGNLFGGLFRGIGNIFK